jgi:hypothetical protein
MNKATTLTLPLALSLAMLLPACSESSSGTEGGHTHGEDTHEHAPENAHVHADGSTHADHDDDAHMGEEDHAHDETPLAPAIIGDMTVELAQGHGAVEANKEGHLVVKLPYNDGGSTVVRAWIGTSDRTLSYVGKGEYAPSHDDYDIHAVAPDPLPADTMWWIEIEKPDGTKVVGSAKPIM